MSSKIHFYLRTDRPNKDGSAPVYLMFTLSRTKRIKISTGKYVSLKKEFQKFSAEQLLSLPAETRDAAYCWDKARERAIKGAINCESINAFLDTEKYRANQIILKFELLNRTM